MTNEIEGHQYSVEHYLGMSQEDLDKLIDQVEQDIEWENKTPLKGWKKTKAFIKRVFND